jgi:MFS family permease
MAEDQYPHAGSRPEAGWPPAAFGVSAGLAGFTLFVALFSAQNADSEALAGSIYLFALAAGVVLTTTVLGVRTGVRRRDRVERSEATNAERFVPLIVTSAVGVVAVVLLGCIAGALATGSWVEIDIDTPLLAWFSGLAVLGGVALGVLLPVRPVAKEERQGRRRRLLGLAALILGLLSLILIPVGLGAFTGLLALACGVLRQRSGSGVRTPSALGITGAVLGAVAVAALVPFLSLRDEEGAHYDRESILRLAVGQCVRGDLEYADVSAISCRAVHDGEVYAVLGHEAGPGEPYPGEEALTSYGDDRCTQPFQEYVGLEFEQSEFGAIALWPTEDSWSAGMRQIVCFATSPEGDRLIRSVRGSRT